MTDMQDSQHDERRATWLELFFDLIVVAGTAQLAHLLHGEPDLADLGLFTVLFFAFWTIWMCFTTYGDVAGARMRTGTMLIGMLGMTVMAAAVAGVPEGRHLQSFAIWYVVLRFVVSNIWRGRGQVLIDWPVAQFSMGTAPWLVSIWVDGPARYWLWAAGLAIDLWTTLSFSAHRFQENFEARTVRTKRQAERHRERRGGPRRPVDITVAYTDSAHLGERLGLFTIIVLGEGVAQLVSIGSGEEWDRTLHVLGFGGFLLLVSVWALSLVHGYGGVPNLRAAALPPRIVLFLHCVTNGALVALAAGLGAALEHRHGELPESVRWLLCASFAAYVVIGLAGAVAAQLAAGGGLRRGALLTHSLPPLAVALLTGLLGSRLPAAAVVWLLVAAALWGLRGYLGRLARPERRSHHTPT
ncbi:low temperature requirement protein A [Streptomyces shenzhenensis]|uniref:low temperature requirement protein A n=1 Tax=Streptomyces shenzhenensis TaxID=943815 RepID=UPI00380876D8